MRAAAALLCATVLVAGLLVPAATAGDLLPSQCATEPVGPATATVCTPRVDDCVEVAFGDGGLARVCLEQQAQDADGDGWTVDEGDCDDADPNTYPGAPELMDGKDNDCDGIVDEGADGDHDLDGFMMIADGDCDDTDADIRPGAAEIADRKDNDCNGVADEGFQDNGDWDGDGVTLDGGDCHDLDGNTYPGATELADRRDNDCNGVAEG